MSDKTNEERIGILEKACDDFNGIVKDLKLDIKELKDILVKRPSWTVCIIITILTTICAALLTSK